VIDAKEKRQKRRTIKLGRTGSFFLIISVVTALTMATMLWISSNQPAIREANAFLTALKNEDYTAAYAQLSDSLQASIGDSAALQAIVLSSEAQPTEWNVATQRTNTRQGSGSVRGGVVAGDGHYYQMFMTLIEQDGEWRISYMRYGRFQLYSNRQ